ncbi:Peptidyl-glycine alpha-amidating monooxygenase A [Echinococcus granulosus]|uniref:Peptidyl glycine alpha amidating monooxygenase n=1 Tax=Echinococcus granulosus TaxID=6210 RepID=U6J026_ECHGR|nr:Peptidyl-glycine alpha-amidating monooxygenase A [Echinococcus granulosus]EUB64496.1 Peptidyl-glycine alpha-amidating monooxygenase A [Echinococcus granulosus]KAH9286920.1 Peptidyl-glycine alpha-amidating monooxygenase A [Echinococcus granulosus]CDS16651.1 peptidyl glycine alpha amidating monooxygenase [Echinococcus granulosus]
MPGAYPRKADEYICTRIPLPDFKYYPGYVTAFKPIVNASVHHIILSSCGTWLGGEEASRPGPCDGQCRTHILYAWAHNGAPLVLPERTAFEIGRTTPIKSLSMEVHYSRYEENPDYATIELTYTLQPQPNRAGIILLYNDEATIPPHAQHFPTNISCRLRTEVPIHVFGIRTHAHDLNRGVYGYYFRPRDGRYQLMAKGNAHWPQTFYRPSQLSAGDDFIRLQNKDILMGRCVYDSTARDTPTSMGSTHMDEMCNLYLMYMIDSHFKLPVESEMCADEMVSGAWDNAPTESLEYVTSTPPAKVPEPSAPSLPRSIDFLPDNEWFIKGTRLGSVSGIALVDDSKGRTHLFVLRRGGNPWNENSFDESFEYNEPDATYVPSPILHLDAHSGQLFEAFGDDLLILPHGISIAKDVAGKPIALFVTDLARHQVIKFAWNEWNKPALILGRRNKTGNDETSFCKPSDVAVASTGEIFVADGYCNQRVVKFSPNGDYMAEWGVGGVDETEGSRKTGFLVAHSITVVPASAEGAGGVEQVCVADRERAQIDCYDLSGRRLVQYGGSILKPSVYAIAFSPAYNLMFGVTGPADATPATIARLQAILDVREEDVESTNNSAFVFRPLLGAQVTNASQHIFRAINGRNHLLHLDLRSPHDVEVSQDGSMLFVAQLRAPYLLKTDIVESAKKSEGGKKMTRSDEGKAAFPAYALTNRTLTQKVFIISTIVTLCTVVTIIALILIRSRKSQPWAWRKPAHLQQRTGHRRGKWKRYDGFRPLQEDELRGLGSALDEDDVEEAAVAEAADSDTIIDIRNFGLLESQQHFSGSSVHSHSQTRKNDSNSASSHHVDT